MAEESGARKARTAPEDVPEGDDDARDAAGPGAGGPFPAGTDPALYEVLRGTADTGVDEDQRLIQQRTRLGIVSSLAVNDSLAFTELRELLGTTDGNLSVHARKLEDAGLIHCEKSFEERVPRTEYRLSARGRRALERYLDHMESLIRAVRDG